MFGPPLVGPLRLGTWGMGGGGTRSLIRMHQRLAHHTDIFLFKDERLCAALSFSLFIPERGYAEAEF